MLRARLFTVLYLSSEKEQSNSVFLASINFLMTHKTILISIFLISFLTACTTKSTKAELIVSNASIWTANEEQPRATAMAISGDSILAIGNLEEVKEFADDATEMKDAGGRFIVPGFIDSHVHLLMGGNALLSVELRDASTKEEFIKRIKTYAESLDPGQWILEGNWDHTLWGGELPKKEWIDEFTADKPLVIFRLDGHMVLANSKALSIAGIDEATNDLEAGEFVRNTDGSLTGILKGSAMTKMLQAIPPMTEEQKQSSIEAATSYLLANGVTSVHDVDSLGTYSAAKELLAKGELGIRIYAANPLIHFNRPDRLIKQEEADQKWLKSGLVKGFVDGSLGSHTAAFKNEYTDKKKDFGYMNDMKNLYGWMVVADFDQKQIAVHAIGDRANSSLFKVYARLIKENGEKDRRLRIEHAQHLHSSDMPRFAELGVIASVQPYHIIDDGRWAEELIGPDRIHTTYAFNSMQILGATLAFGSDWPVAPASPLMGIYAATTRRTLDGKNPDGWIPKQKISVEQSLLAFTKNAAFASFDEPLKGSLEVGKLADFVILSDDLTQIEPKAIKEVYVLETYVGGKKLFEREEE